MQYFKYFPLIEYSNNQSVNILARAKIRDYIKNNVYVYFPYVIEGNIRPDVLSEAYYGSWKYAWIIYYANDIFDPVREWVMSDSDFQNYINYKYSWDGSSQELSIQQKRTSYQLNHSPKSLYSILVSITSDYSNVLTPGKDYTFSSNRKQIIFDYNSIGSVPSKIYILYPNVLQLTDLTVDNVSSLYGDVGFQVAHQTIHHYENSEGYVVSLNDWYYETVSELSRHAYNWSQYNNNRQIVRIRNKDGLPVFIKMKSVNCYFENKNTIVLTSLSESDRNYLLNKIVILNYGINNFGVKISKIVYNIITSSYTLTLERDVLDIPNGTNITMCYFGEDDIKSNEYETQRYNPNTFVTFSFNDSSKKVISNYQYENEQNENRRTIKLIDSKYTKKIVDELKILLGE